MLFVLGSVKVVNLHCGGGAGLGLFSRPEYKYTALGAHGLGLLWSQALFCSVLLVWTGCLGEMT